MHDNFAKKKFPGRYLTSNAYINITNGDGKNETVPIGREFSLNSTVFIFMTQSRSIYKVQDTVVSITSPLVSHQRE